MCFMQHAPREYTKTVKNMDGLNVEVLNVSEKDGGIGWISEYTARNGIHVFTVEAAAEKGTICLGVYIEDRDAAEDALSHLHSIGEPEWRELGAPVFLKTIGEFRISDALAVSMSAVEYMNRHYGRSPRRFGYYDCEKAAAEKAKNSSPYLTSELIRVGDNILTEIATVGDDVHGDWAEIPEIKFSLAYFGTLRTQLLMTVETAIQFSDYMSDVFAVLDRKWGESLVDFLRERNWDDVEQPA